MPMVVCDAISLNCARNEKGKHSASAMSIARIVTLNGFDCNPDPESLQNLIIGYVFIIKNSMVNIIKCVFILVAGLIMARYLKC